jgi:hypothetical protein
MDEQMISGYSHIWLLHACSLIPLLSRNKTNSDFGFCLVACTISTMLLRFSTVHVGSRWLSRQCQRKNQRGSAQHSRCFFDNEFVLDSVC